MAGVRTIGESGYSPLWSVSSQLPSQIQRLDGQRARGEFELLFTLLSGAFHDLNLPPLSRLHRDAREWLLSGNTGQFTAPECCDFFDLDYPSVRQAVLEGRRIHWTRRGRNRNLKAEAQAKRWQRTWLKAEEPAF